MFTIYFVSNEQSRELNGFHNEEGLYPKRLCYLLCNLKSVLVCVNFMHDDASMARCEKGS